MEDDADRGYNASSRSIRIAQTPLRTVTPPGVKLYSADLASLL